MKSFPTHHPSEGQWRAYLDAELTVQHQKELTSHLTGCVRCRKLYSQVQKTASTAAVKINALRGAAEVAMVPPPKAGGRVALKEEDSSIMSRIPVRWIAGAAAALLVSSLMIPSVRATAAGWLTVFRAQEAQVVRIDLGELATLANGAGGRGGSSMAGGQIPPELRQRISQLVEVEVIRTGEHRKGLSLRDLVNRDFVRPAYLPAGFSDAGAGGEIMSSSERLFKVDVDGANAIVGLMGSRERLPAELKGETIRVYQGQSATYTYQGGGQELIVMQGATPEISATGKVDLNQILSSIIGGLGAQFGLPTGLSDQLLAMDLSRTIPLPLIQGMSEEMKVNGATGAYYHQEGQAAVVWVKNGRVHAVYGTIARDELLRVAESIGG